MTFVEEGAADVLAEDAPVVWRRPCHVKVHLRVIEQEVLRDATLEIALPVRPDPYDTRLAVAVSPDLALLVEEVDAVLRQQPKIKRILDSLELRKLVMKPLAELGHRRVVKQFPRDG